jgi:preprotein translocase subunit SecA
MICESTAGFYLDLKTEIERRRNNTQSGKGSTKRAVLVFFHNKKTMLEFYDSSFMKSLKQDSQVITEETSREEREGLFTKATEKGAITLMIRDFGRGTDFKCYDQDVLEAGGVHVIQAFFSTDPSEEIQIRGRCARQGDDGSFR